MFAPVPNTTCETRTNLRKMSSFHSSSFCTCLCQEEWSFVKSILSRLKKPATKLLCLNFSATPSPFVGQFWALWWRSFSSSLRSIEFLFRSFVGRRHVGKACFAVRWLSGRVGALEEKAWKEIELEACVFVALSGSLGGRPGRRLNWKRSRISPMLRLGRWD